MTFITNNVPEGSYSLRSIFRTIGKRFLKMRLIRRSLFACVDTSGDGSVEKSEFEQAKKNPNLNKTLVEIFENKFQQDSTTKLTYEGKHSFA